MQGTRGPGDSSHIVQLLEDAWKTAVRYVMRKAPYAKALPVWWLKPLQQTLDIMDFTQWSAGGCNEAGDLYINNNFNYNQANSYNMPN